MREARLTRLANYPRPHPHYPKASPGAAYNIRNILGKYIRLQNYFESEKPNSNQQNAVGCKDWLRNHGSFVRPPNRCAR